MGRNNERNAKAHNEKLHKAQRRAKEAKAGRAAKLSAIIKKHNDSKPQ